jgi:hypothetical protein
MFNRIPIFLYKVSKGYPMNKTKPFEFPEITDDDILWVSQLLGLQKDAFYGKDGADPRKDVLKYKESIDVSACPGSGKTTLLVGKLAILGEKWRYNTRGICVLSHTNAARKKIETRLGNTNAGRRLLTYPHFIGTIHSFINEFLALPWLRSKNNTIKMIDTKICQELRWKDLEFITRNALEKNRYNCSILSIKSPDFDICELHWGKGILGKNTSIYKNIRETCKSSVSKGYFCYDEMFIWAKEMMDRLPYIVNVIRNRFPILFIDEAQDNSKEQSEILYRIFMKGNNPVIRQRFGDENQAIFDFMEANEATTDKFHNEAIKRDIPNSYRFGQRIADLADPLGLIPYSMKGQGPKNQLSSGVSEGKHTIFIFDEDKPEKLLNDYAELLIEIFSEKELREGTFTAVGQVHKYKSDDNKPRHVGHYWPSYDPDISNIDPKPQTFVQYIWAGIGKAEMIGETFPVVEKIAEAILRLAGMSKNLNIFFNRRHFHRYLLQLLENKPNAMDFYKKLISKIAVLRKLPTQERWEERVAEKIRKIAEGISGATLSGTEVEEFLSWKQCLPAPNTQSQVTNKRNNLYHFTKDRKELAIRLGSIHSVKGEDHAATLVLETFWHKNNLEKLLSWLIGEKTGRDSESNQQQSRLKVHYVAMTRPSHLLCLAMKMSSFKDSQGVLNNTIINKLKDRGWHIKFIK